MSTTNTFHSERASSGRIQDVQFLSGEPHREQERSHRDKQKNNHRETDSSDGLGDGKGGTEANQLDNDKGPDCSSPVDSLQGVGSWREIFVLGEENQFLRDAVALESLDSHDEEQASHDALWNQVENNKKRTGHCAQSQESLSKIADALFYDVVGDSDGLALVRVIFIGNLAGDAESSSVERSLGNESIGEWDTKNSGNKGGEA